MSFWLVCRDYHIYITLLPRQLHDSWFCLRSCQRIIALLAFMPLISLQYEPRTQFASSFESYCPPNIISYWNHASCKWCACNMFQQSVYVQHANVLVRISLWNFFLIYIFHIFFLMNFCLSYCLCACIRNVSHIAHNLRLCAHVLPLYHFSFAMMTSPYCI